MSANKAVWLAILLIFALLLIADWGYSSLAPGSVSQGQQSTKCGEEYCHIEQMISYRFVARTLDEIDRRHDLVTAASTVVLAFFTIALWRATSGLLSSGEKNMRALERAYLALGPTAIQLRPGGAGTSVSVTVHNIGRTAAFIGLVYGEFSETPPKGDAPRYEHGEGRLVDFGIAAGTDAGKLPVDFNSDLTDAHYFWGYIEFKDIFRVKHTAKFCTIIRPGDGKFDIAGTPAWNDWD